MSLAADYATGWAAAAVLAAALLVSIASLVQRRRRRPIGRPWRRAHYWLGTAAALTGAGHCLLSVRKVPLPLGPEVGIWAAAIAVVLLLATMVIGAALRAGQSDDRVRARRNHLLALGGVVVLGLAHTWLNGPYRFP